MIVWDGSQKIVFEGSATFENISDWLMQWEQLNCQPAISNETALILNCGRIEKADSSFIALLVEIWRWSQGLGKMFILEELPSFLTHFLTVYGVESILLHSSMSQEPALVWPGHRESQSLKNTF